MQKTRFPVPTDPSITQFLSSGDMFGRESKKFSKSQNTKFAVRLQILEMSEVMIHRWRSLIHTAPLTRPEYQQHQ